MSAAATALSVIALLVFLTVAFALRAVRHFKMDPQEFIVGNRSFGALLLWVLMGGEIYTAFTFMGAAGWAYGKGAPAFYILAYLPLGYIISYVFLPTVWRLGKERGLMTWPDFMIDGYGSKALGAFVALLQFVLTVPYVTLQLTGLQILLTIAGYGHYNADIAVGISFALMALFVFSAGLRGAAWASIIKDATVLAAALFAGIYLPVHFFGSPANAITHLLQTRPGWFTLATAGAPYGTLWYVSTVIVTGFGVFVGANPAGVQSVFSAKDEATVRRNFTFLPLYTILAVLTLLAGFTALLVLPGVTGTDTDQSFVLVVQRYFSPWIVGFVCGAGCLAALLPASVFLLGAATVVSRNLLGHTRWVRPAVLVCAALSLLLWLVAKTSLVDLLLLVFNGVTQLAPPIILGLVWKRVNAWGATAGLISGIAIAILTLHASAGPWGVNLGLAALSVNTCACVLVTLLQQAAGAIGRSRVTGVGS